MNTFTSYVAGLLRYGGDRSTTHVSDSNAGASHPARTASTIVEWNLPDADLVEVIVQSSISDQVLDVLLKREQVG